MTDPLAPLRAKFLDRREEDLSIRRAPETAQLVTVAHRLAGAAGVFSYHELGVLALRVDDRARAAGQVDAQELRALVKALEVLRAAQAQG